LYVAFKLIGFIFCFNEVNMLKGTKGFAPNVIN